MLDQAKRQTVLALLAGGHSRRIASAFVDCSPSTISRTAQRDPAFAEEVARAQHAAQIHLLRALTSAARQDRYWRAGAWLLERLNPVDFTLQPPDTHTTEEVLQIIAKMSSLIATELPEEHRRMVADKFEMILQEFVGTLDPTHLPAAASDFCASLPPNEVELTSTPQIENPQQ